MMNGPYSSPPQHRHTRQKKQADFDEFEATELYCLKCRRAVPVRKFLLLVLPEGDKYEYRCAHCGSVVGDKLDRSGQYQGLIRT